MAKKGEVLQTYKDKYSLLGTLNREMLIRNKQFQDNQAKKILEEAQVLRCNNKKYNK